ncbi:hypothetical protein SAMN04488129_1226 [Halomonas daqiaonensis]|uniref:Uncharacterized protein n=1 Tax=Halomonas daqiaonensis TaxID=650850 RepID=A0A1H7UWS4_9GAMM|nr:hypothetical protein SAMN04488129_1226 [Halomonas daqiaonensis]
MRFKRPLTVGVKRILWILSRNASIRVELDGQRITSDRGALPLHAFSLVTNLSKFEWPPEKDTPSVVALKPTRAR